MKKLLEVVNGRLEDIEVLLEGSEEIGEVMKLVGKKEELELMREYLEREIESGL